MFGHLCNDLKCKCSRIPDHSIFRTTQVIYPTYPDASKVESHTSYLTQHIKILESRINQLEEKLMAYAKPSKKKAPKKKKCC